MARESQNKYFQFDIHFEIPNYPAFKYTLGGDMLVCWRVSEAHGLISDLPSGVHYPVTQWIKRGCSSKRSESDYVLTLKTVRC